jgi:integrase
MRGAEDGTIRNRSGDAYKPSALRAYEQAMRLRVLPDFGAERLSELTRLDIQDFADRLVADDADPSTIRNTLLPLRAPYRRAVARGEVTLNPTSGIELPAVRSRRDRVASPAEAAALIEALPIADRALWATAMYAGLRSGELQALAWSGVDLAKGVIRVERGWDAKAGLIAPKSRAGTRKVPVPVVLRGYLVEHQLATGRWDGLVFGRTAERPFDPRS